MWRTAALICLFLHNKIFILEYKDVRFRNTSVRLRTVSKMKFIAFIVINQCDISLVRRLKT